MTGAAGPAADSLLPPELVRAYRETDYRVAAEPPFVLRIDEPCAGLAAWMAAQAAPCGAFLTACNPRSVLLDDTRNAQAQVALGEVLRAGGWNALPAVGAHPRGGWPGEPSWFVPGIGLEDACRIARRFDQNAIVWFGADAIPRLQLLR